MNQDHSSVPFAPGRFDATHWSLVLEAAQSEAPGAVEALAELCTQYWPPLYAFARHRGHSPENAQDLVQGFFEHLIGSHGLRSVAPAKGRFRSLLLASFQNYRVTEIRRSHREKRGGCAELIRLDWKNAEGQLAFEPADRITPEILYDAQWALLLLDRAAKRLEQEYEASGKAQVFATLRGFLGNEGPQERVSYEESARALQSSVSAIRTMVHRFRRRHGQLVREEVAQTVTDPAQVDAEVHALCESLIAAGRRVCRSGHAAVFV
ncbi:MAG TPA: sigma-70 family RNA polymerase sigma factor [Chthoniobacterales bacterium]|nr:sigma-70 family RNA polymerase sigma factor [Chthoniobacterales bacterium]